MDVQTPMTRDYDALSTVQLAGNLLNVGRLTESLHCFQQDSLIHMGDFASATGLNSMKTFTPALVSLRERSNTEVVVHHVDLPTNHWETLMNNYWNSEFSYRHITGVYMSAVGGSLYTRVFPKDYLSLVYSSSALHWLSELVPVTADMTLEALNKATKERSDSDLRLFLSHRYEELKTGGRILTRAAVTSIHKSLISHLLQSPAFQSLPREFFLSMIGRIRHRTLSDYEEVLTSFTDKYKVIELTEETREHPLFTQLNRDGDREKFADRMIEEVKTVATSSITTIAKGLGMDTNQVMEATYAEMRRFFLETTEQGVVRDVVMVLEKRGS